MRCCVVRTRCGKNEKNKKINKAKKKKQDRSPIVAVGLRRIAGAEHPRRRRSENSDERAAARRVRRAAQEVRPFLQMEKYYSHYRGAAKVWPSRSLPFNTDLREKLATWGIETVFYQAISSRNVISCRSLVTDNL